MPRLVLTKLYRHRDVGRIDGNGVGAIHFVSLSGPMNREHDGQHEDEGRYGEQVALHVFSPRAKRAEGAKASPVPLPPFGAYSVATNYFVMAYGPTTESPDIWTIGSSYKGWTSKL
jgi:hypothetical protein